MILKRIQFYFFLLAISILPFIFYKVFWLANSIATVGYVSDTRQIRIGGTVSATRQEYPVIEYAVEGENLTGYGDYNLPYSPGDKYPLRYSRFDHKSIRLNTFLGCWIETFIWSTIFFVLVSIIFLVDGIVPKEKVTRLYFWGFEFVDKSN